MVFQSAKGGRGAVFCAKGAPTRTSYRPWVSNNSRETSMACRRSLLLVVHIAVWFRVPPVVLVPWMPWCWCAVVVAVSYTHLRAHETLMNLPSEVHAADRQCALVKGIKAALVVAHLRQRAALVRGLAGQPRAFLGDPSSFLRVPVLLRDTLIRITTDSTTPCGRSAVCHPTLSAGVITPPGAGAYGFLGTSYTQTRL
eukprot:1195078-Prorocentrum_minimum.AAC.3